LKHFTDFKPSGISFEQQVGEPHAFPAAIGMITLNFAFLEDTISNVLVLLMGAPEEVARVVLAQLTFRSKVDVLSALARLRFDEHVDAENVEWCQELITCVRKASELRNSYVHSSFVSSARIRTTARARAGLITVREKVDAGLALDVAFFIGSIGVEAENLPGTLALADDIKGPGDGSVVEYWLHGEVVGRFPTSNR